METIEINGRSFTIRKLSAMQQFHVARRLSPIIAAFIDGVPSVNALASTLDKINLTKIGEEIASLSDKDAEYILTTCMGAVTYRDNEAQRDFPIQSRPGVMAYDWIGLPEMIRLMVSVIQFNLAGFTTALLPVSSAPGAA